MLKRALPLFVLAMFAGTTLHAALPPLYQSLNEYKTLLESKELQTVIPSGQGIELIKRKNDGFIIKTSKYVIFVKVVNDPMDHPGPAKFHLEFGKPQPRDE